LGVSTLRADPFLDWAVHGAAIWLWHLPELFATALMFWCHTIPGVRGATATVGPPLQQLRQRVYLGGVGKQHPGLARQMDRRPA
jgi:hypothetical protein